MNWQTFGSSGHLERPSGLQIENFVMRGPLDFGWNTHIKTFARPPAVSGAPNCHHFTYKHGYSCVNEDGRIVPESESKPPTARRMQLNHYFTRSKAEFLEKIGRMAADGSQKRMEFFDVTEKHCNSVRDEGILRFVPALKAALENRK